MRGSNPGSLPPLDSTGAFVGFILINCVKLKFSIVLISEQFSEKIMLF